MAGFAEATNRRLHELTEIVSDKLRDRELLLEVINRESVSLFEYLASMTFYSLDIIHFIDQLVTELQELLQGVKMLMQGNLSPFFLPEETLRKTLLEIVEALHSHH